MAFSNIADSEIAAYVPVTSRLLRKMRGNADGTRSVPLTGKENIPTGTGGLSASWQTVATLPLFINGMFVGRATPATEVIVRCRATPGAAASGNYLFRVLIGADASDETSLIAGTGADDRDYTVQLTPTADAISDIELQVQKPAPLDPGGTFEWRGVGLLTRLD